MPERLDKDIRKSLCQSTHARRELGAATLAVIELDRACLRDGALYGCDHLCVRSEPSESKRVAMAGLTTSHLLGIKSE